MTYEEPALDECILAYYFGYTTQVSILNALIWLAAPTAEQLSTVTGIPVSRMRTKLASLCNKKIITAHYHFNALTQYKLNMDLESNKLLVEFYNRVRTERRM